MDKKTGLHDALEVMERHGYFSVRKKIATRLSHVLEEDAAEDFQSTFEVFFLHSRNPHILASI